MASVTAGSLDSLVFKSPMSLQIKIFSSTSFLSIDEKDFFSAKKSEVTISSRTVTYETKNIQKKFGLFLFFSTSNEIVTPSFQ